MEPRPLTILDITQAGVRLNTEAFNSVLNKVGDKHLVIYSISGATRSGKSYLLNYFIKYFEAQKHNQQQNIGTINSGPDQNWINFPLTSSFAWRSGKERETTGMNLWSEPYFVQTETGPVAVLLMDTQGLFDDKTTARQNAIIFSLTALCSSVTIFNVMRQINEDLLQQIQYFSSYAKMVAAEPTGTRLVLTNESAPSSHSTFSTVTGRGAFENLLLLVRDFEIPDYVHGAHGRIKEPKGSRNNFMRDTFHLESRPLNCPDENTMARQAILQNYDDVSVYLLPDPGKKFIVSGNNDIRPDEDFQEELKSFIEYMTCPKNLRRRRLSGRPCTGTQFKSFVSSWARLVQKSEETFPMVLNMAENTAFMHYTIAKDMAVSYFIQKMNTLVSNIRNGGSHHLSRKREQAACRNEAVRIFHRMKKFQNNKFESDFQKQLEDAIKEHLEITAHLFQEEELENSTTYSSPETKEFGRSISNSKKLFVYGGIITMIIVMLYYLMIHDSVEPRLIIPSSSVTQSNEENPTNNVV